jgi:MFS family permease
MLLGGFLWLEAKRGDRAIMAFALFATPTFIGLTLLTFFLYASLGGLLVLLPYLLIRIEGYSAVAAGAAMLPLPILIGLGSPVMGRLSARYGGRLPLAVGPAVVAAGFALYRRVDAGGIDYWTDILPATLLVAIGMGVSVAPLTTTVMASVDPDHVGAASGFNSAMARIAGLIATALLGFVFAQQGSAFVAVSVLPWQANAVTRQVAYAHVFADGTLDTANSVGIADWEKVPGTVGLYCFRVVFTPRNVVASIEEAPNGSDPGVIIRASLDTQSISYSIQAPNTVANVLDVNIASVDGQPFYILWTR